MAVSTLMPIRGVGWGWQEQLLPSLPGAWELTGEKK